MCITLVWRRCCVCHISSKIFNQACDSVEAREPRGRQCDQLSVSETWNRYIVNRRQEVGSDETDVTSSAIPLQTQESAAAKCQSPTVDIFVAGTMSASVEDLSWCLEGTSAIRCRSCAKLSGVQTSTGRSRQCVFDALGCSQPVRAGQCCYWSKRRSTAIDLATAFVTDYSRRNVMYGKSSKRLRCRSAVGS